MWSVDADAEAQKKKGSMRSRQYLRTLHCRVLFLVTLLSCCSHAIKFCGPLAAQCISVSKSAINERSVLPFKDAHHGWTGVLLGNGPTRDQFQVEESMVTFGIKDIVYHRPRLDYLFELDKGTVPGSGWAANREAVDAYQCHRQKFYGWYPEAKDFGPDPAAVASANATQIEVGGIPTYKATALIKDVGRYPLGGSASSSILVLQFALYTGVSTLYVVGCDGNSTLGHAKHINYMWKVAFAFVQKEYPAVQLVYVQPPAKIVEHGRGLGVHLVNATTHQEAQALIQAGKSVFRRPPAA